jgi:thiol-disulfide isomerase/thioredoxin
MSLAGRPIAEPDPRTRFPLEAEAQIDPSGTELEGTWQMEFDVWGSAEGTFVQHAGGVVRGTIVVPIEYGDLQFLAGNVRGRHLRLSTFNGQYAVLLEGELMPNGAMKGVIIYNDSWDSFVAERVASVALPDPLGRVRPIGEDRRLDLEPLRDPKYAGKAVIVDIFGTWCPNCNAQTPLLTELYRRHHDDGLEILGLAYEYTDNLEFKQRRIQAFRERHGVEWEIVIAESSLDALAIEGGLGLSPIAGVPITVFVNRDGTVHAVYTGFSGPATGEAYVQLKADFARLTGEIVDGL